MNDLKWYYRVPLVFILWWTAGFLVITTFSLIAAVVLPLGRAFI